MVGTIDDLFSIRIVDRTDMWGNFLRRIDQPEFWKIIDLKAHSLVEDPELRWITKIEDDAREEAFAQILPYLLNESAAFYLTINGVGQAVGYAIGDVSQTGPKKAFQILDLYTHNQFRGKGFSKHIALRMLEHAKRAGFSDVTAVIPGYKTKAIGLYEAMGFEKVKDVRKPRMVYRSGEVVQDKKVIGFLYSKHLGNPARPYSPKTLN